MKFCKDCAHWRKNPSSTPKSNLDYCMRHGEPPPEVSLVTGEPVQPKRYYAELERKYDCGADAKYFEPFKPDSISEAEREGDNVPF